MQTPAYPIAKDLVFVGGGHSHAIALKLWGMQPILGVRATLISNTTHTPYSGMLPGHVAGFYSYDETHIDLRRLCRFAGVQFYRDEAIALDLANRRVLCADRPPVAFDLLSLDIGSTPQRLSVPGAAEYAIPAKPVPQFLQAWNQILAQSDRSWSLAIVGGGAGGVELALNIGRRLSENLDRGQLTVHLFHRGDRLMTGHNNWVSQRIEQVLRQRGIEIHLRESVREVLPEKIICDSGLAVECDRVFWVTQASPPEWICNSGLATDARGFILVNDTLESVSHEGIFAAGDIATIQKNERPKAGVFAVRQGKPLFENLHHRLQERPLKPYKPQKFYLALIGTGDKRAIASWGRFGWHSAWLWRWKDRIDRQFMDRFALLPAMETMQPKSSILPELKPNVPMYCAGCGSKVGSTILEQTLQRLAREGRTQIDSDADVCIGLETPDDAAVVQVRSDRLQIHAIDRFHSLVDDPYLFGKIAANHCLSDIWAMGATPQTALATVAVPYGKDKPVAESLYQLLAGTLEVLRDNHTALIGGHTTEGETLALGLACHGTVAPEKLLRKSGLQPGQVLIINKAIGTGTLFAADKQYRAIGRWIDGAIASMLLSNRRAAGIFREFGATALTDITGFGLLGHLLEMVRASQVAAELDLDAIPVLEGAIDTASAGIVSSLQPQNLHAARFLTNAGSVVRSPRYPLLFDPQTSGGLLAAIPAENANPCLAALHDLEYPDASAIARVLEGRSQPEALISIRI